MAAVVPVTVAPDSQKQFAGMTELLNQYRSLRAPTELSENEREEFGRTWHVYFIFLSKLRGVRPVSPAGTRGRRSVMPTGMPAYRRRRSGIPGAGILRFAFRLFVFVVVVYVLGRTIGIQKDEAGHVGFQPPASVHAAVGNFIDGSRNVGGALGHFLSPVVAAYGTEVTVVLVGVLILGISYLIFVKG